MDMHHTVVYNCWWISLCCSPKFISLTKIIHYPLLTRFTPWHFSNLSKLYCSKFESLHAGPWLENETWSSTYSLLNLPCFCCFRQEHNGNETFHQWLGCTASLQWSSRTKYTPVWWRFSQYFFSERTNTIKMVYRQLALWIVQYRYSRKNCTTQMLPFSFKIYTTGKHPGTLYMLCKSRHKLVSFVFNLCHRINLTITKHSSSLSSAHKNHKYKRNQ